MNYIKTNIKSIGAFVLIGFCLSLLTFAAYEAGKDAGATQAIQFLTDYTQFKPQAVSSINQNAQNIQTIVNFLQQQIEAQKKK